MKYSILFFFSLFGLISCTKDEPEEIIQTDCVANCDLIGTWEWIRTYGSIAGQTWTPSSTGVEKELKIDQSYLSFFENDILIDQFLYQAFDSDTIFNDTMSYSFITYQGNTRRYEIDDDQLTFFDLCFDCNDDYYQKK